MYSGYMLVLVFMWSGIVVTGLAAFFSGVLLVFDAECWTQHAARTALCGALSVALSVGSFHVLAIADRDRAEDLCAGISPHPQGCDAVLAAMHQRALETDQEKRVEAAARAASDQAFLTGYLKRQQQQ